MEIKEESVVLGNLQSIVVHDGFEYVRTRYKHNDSIGWTRNWYIAKDLSVIPVAMSPAVKSSNLEEMYKSLTRNDKIEKILKCL